MLIVKEKEYAEVEAFMKRIFQEQAASHFEQIRDRIDETLTLGAYLDEQLVGAILTKREYDHLYIELLTVDGAYQGQQIGRRLMNEIERIAAEKQIINITLKTRSYQAAGFYEKCGYECYATLKDMPMRGVSMHYFVKRLSED